jgi:hypothetical protein
LKRTVDDRTRRQRGRRPGIRRIDETLEPDSLPRGTHPLATIPVVLASTFLLGGVAQGAVPVSFAVSGSQFQISASKLEGTGFSQYAGVTQDTAGGSHNVAIANIASAQLYDLCQSVISDTPLGKVGVLITAGGGGSPGHRERPADRHDRPQGRFVVLQHPHRRRRLDREHGGEGLGGRLRQDADGVTINNLQQISWSTQASVFTLTGMSLKLTDGSSGCF